MISSYYTKTLCMNCMKITYRGERCPVCGARRSSVKNSSRALPVNYLLHRRYLIGKVLGEGGFGITYLAWDEKEERRVAIKEYMPQGLTTRVKGTGEITAVKDIRHYEKYLKRFLEEAQIIYQYRNHPNIIHVNHLFRENHSAYYVMEYLEGIDLREKMIRSGNRLTWEELKPILGQVVSALHAVHQGGIIHCDISPDNILLEEGGRVKVIDFGAAKSDIGGNSSMLILKQGFAPPEQYVQHGKLGPWTDIYALAVTIYFCLTGKMPQKSIDRLLGDQIIMPSAMGIVFPPDFHEEALRSGLELYVDRRYRDVRTFWYQLTKARNPTAGFRIPSENMMDDDLELYGLSGTYENRRIHLVGTVFAGKTQNCTMRFPPDAPFIGNVHFRIWVGKNCLYIVDMNSGYPTFLNNRKMSPGLVYEVKQGEIIRFGKEEVLEVIPERR